MEINIEYTSSDTICLPKLSNTTADLLSEKEIRNILKSNYLFLYNIDNEEYYDININPINSIKNNNIKENNNKNNNEIIIEIKCKEKLSQDLKTNINICMDKELKLIKMQEEFTKNCNNFDINKELLSKKLFTFIEYDINSYEDVYNKIVAKFLDYQAFINELNEIENKLIKYRESELFCYYFIIYYNCIEKLVQYLLSKEILLLNCKKIFENVVDISIDIISKLLIQINDCVKEKIKDNPIYIINKETYEKKMNFIKEIFLLFPLSKYFDDNEQYEIFKINKNKTIDLSEVEFEEVLKNNLRIPKNQGLNRNFQYFKEHTNYREAFGMSLRRLLLLHQKYKIIYPEFVKSLFLFGK